MADLFFINQTVELQVGEGSQTRVVVGVVREVGADRLIVEPVSESDVSAAFPQGITAELFFVRPDALYSMPTEVFGLETRPVARLFLRRDDAKVNRVQRRQYFRVNVKVRILYRWEGGFGDQPEEVQKTTYTRDLSAGGVLLQLSEQFSYNDRLWMEIFLPDEANPIGSFGRVVRVRPLNTAQGRCYLTGVEFVDMNEPARSRITRFLFRLQAQKRM
jgi:c-di-GMP-binding flagellar brake protein YcgR